MLDARLKIVVSGVDSFIYTRIHLEFFMARLIVSLHLLESTTTHQASDHLLTPPAFALTPPFLSCFVMCYSPPKREKSRIRVGHR